MVYLGLLVFLAATDLCLKYWIERQDDADFPRPVSLAKGTIVLHKHHNAGFPFGFLQKRKELVRTVPLVVTAALCGALAALMGERGQRGKKLGLAVVIGGSLSNLYDRYVRHYVVDYFSFPVKGLKRVIFNLGDLCVFLGTAWLFLMAWVRELRRK